MAFFQDKLGKQAGTRKVNRSGFYWSKRWWGGSGICTSLQTDNHASTSPLKFLQAGCPSATQPTAAKH